MFVHHVKVYDRKLISCRKYLGKDFIILMTELYVLHCAERHAQSKAHLKISWCRKCARGYINPKLSSSIHAVEIMPGHRSILNSGQNPM